MGKVRDEKSIDLCNLCMMYHAHPSQEWSCYSNKYPRHKEKPSNQGEKTDNQEMKSLTKLAEQVAKENTPTNSKEASTKGGERGE